MIFFHVAKNGGTTIRNLFMKFDHVDVKFRTTIAAQLPLMKKYAVGQGEPGKVLVVEQHFGADPTLRELAITMDLLRQTCEANNVPFFVVTAFREPLSYGISFYNFENMGKLAKYEHGNATEEGKIPTPADAQ